MSTIAVSAITSAIVSAGIFFLLSDDPLPWQKQEAESVAVPKLKGMPSMAATELLQAKGLRLIVDAEEEDDTVSKGQVISQKPLAASVVESGSEVRVVVSSGIPQETIPKVEGFSRKEAEAKLADAGFVVDIREEAGTEGTPPGSALRTEPAARQSVPRGAPITLYVTPAGIVMPNLVGSSYRSALKKLEELGLTKGETKRRYDETKREFVVLSQAPAAESSVPLGQAVNIVYND